MTRSGDDPNLPGDEEPLELAETTKIVRIDTPAGPVQAWAEMMTVSPEEQAIQRHNRLRYAELEKLRRGEPNRYNETRYRS